MLFFSHLKLNNKKNQIAGDDSVIMISSPSSMAQTKLNVEKKWEHCDNDHMILLGNLRNKLQIFQLLIYHSNAAI